MCKRASVCRLDALRAQRLRSNPKEEQALLDSAKALTAASRLSNGNAPLSAMEAAAEGASEAAPDQAASAPAQGRGGGKGRGRGRGRAKAHKWVPRRSLNNEIVFLSQKSFMCCLLSLSSSHMLTYI